MQNLAQFDLFRLSKSKKEADLAPNTVRAYAKQGLPIFKVGRSCWVSRTELANFIRTRAAMNAAPVGGGK